MIQVKEISKIVDGRILLDNISFNIMPGEILVVMGPSGAGKSTFVRNVALIDIPSTGEILVNNKSVFNSRVDFLDKQGLYPNVTIVFQQFFLWPHLTVHENILLGLKGRIDDSDNIIGACKRFGIDELLSKYPNEISVGQKQKVSLLRAVVLKPMYLFLDEVTSALDIESTMITLNYLNELKKQGVGIVFVTHALHIAQKIADKVVFIEDGKIIESGDREILFHPKSERLKKFIDTPIYT
jgi:arginine transport system ATP-binding protein